MQSLELGPGFGLGDQAEWRGESSGQRRHVAQMHRQRLPATAFFRQGFSFRVLGRVRVPVQKSMRLGTPILWNAGTRSSNRARKQVLFHALRPKLHAGVGQKRSNRPKIFRARAAANRSAAQEFGHRLGARAHLELFVDAPDVGVHGFVADAEFLGDFLVEKALRQQVEHFALAR